MGSRGGPLRFSYTHHEWNDSVGDELVDEVGIEFDSLAVCRIFTATQWDNS